MKESLKGDDATEMTAAVEALNQLWHAASEEMYKQASAQQAGSPASDNGNGQPTEPTQSAEPNSNADAVEAEFEEVK